MKTKSLLSFFAAVLILLQPLSAQQLSIKGKVLDANDKCPVEFANISLLKQDSTLVDGVTSDENGMFKISNILNGNYLLSTSFIGYKTSYVPVQVLDASGSFLEIMLHPSSIMLNEVTIAAKSIINKVDRKLILPSQNLIKSSTDGLDLLKKMQLSRIMIDPITSEVMVSGNGEVQLRINGIQVTSTEITAIKPEDVVRVEYHDSPGARYGNASAVIDYITRHSESGGNIRGGSMHGLSSKKTSADDMLSMKFNNKKSEFSANISYQRRKQDWTREYDETFVYPDHEVNRLEIGEPTAFDKSKLTSNVNYSLQKKESYFFNAQLRYTYLDFPAAYEDRRSKLYTSGSDIPLSVYDHTTERSNSPALDLYFQKNMKDNQLLIFNVVGTYIGTKNTRIYQEQRESVTETDIYSKISGDKYSLIAEGIYEKNIGSSKFTGGLKHLQAYTGNQYGGTTVADVAMRQAESSAYAEYQGKIRHFGYMANLTVSRFYYSQDGNGTSKYSFQPTAQVTYSADNDLFFRYRIGLQNNIPSLAYLNDVAQIIDPMQERKGNPNLKSFRSLGQNFTAGYDKGIWGAELLVTYDYQYKPIMESVIYESGLFVRTYENQKAFQNLSAELTLKLKPWKDYISLSVTPKINRYISEGNNYLHTYTIKELRVNLDFSYKNYLLNFSTITPPNRFMYGEQLSKGELMTTVTAGYKQPNWTVMLGVFCPFTKTYKADNENWSALNPVKSQIHTKNMTQMFFVKCNFNINFGKQFRSANKRINNSDIDSGIMSGTKD
ncbi:carboxypeptidase-like regulatory domain-containing protein [Prevotella sp. 10(H)]|uniref:TonB-dependent receptor n=1 Tax=Prevotella sp. 10(H) TaxID=1158294 RepID=UPI0004A76F43|nr:carboxypeptidase-like regulatory domain-containing protein [Prevotella sp. 10(H)]